MVPSPPFFSFLMTPKYSFCLSTMRHPTNPPPSALPRGCQRSCNLQSTIINSGAFFNSPPLRAVNFPFFGVRNTKLRFAFFLSPLIFRRNSDDLLTLESGTQLSPEVRTAVKNKLHMVRRNRSTLTGIQAATVLLLPSRRTPREGFVLSLTLSSSPWMDFL